MISWQFYSNNGGQESGLNDAGVETFKGNLEQYLAREVVQNSLDARETSKKPVTVKFESMELPPSEIPDMDGLAKTLRRCTNYWKDNQKAVEFFKRAERIAKARKVAALRIGDYNTHGVTGDDDDRKGEWYSLVRCSGASPKGAGAGGSFGIGKNAPFAASRLRVILYSTKTTRGRHAFQGVAKLASHEHPDGGVAQPVGYLAGTGGASVRTRASIPKRFRREKPGTDIIVLGYHNEGSWERDIVHSVLEYFWPAIHFGDLEVEVAGRRINRETLGDLLLEFNADEDFDAHHYYRAFTDPEAKYFSQKLPNLKKVELWLLPGDDLPKHVAMVRKTGMVIFKKRFRVSIVPYCGVFLCRNDTGNELLRGMEPPRHDKWDPDHPEKNQNKKIAKEFTDFIRECVRELTPSDNEKVLDIPDLSEYLPDEEEDAEEPFGDDPQEPGARKEGFLREPEPRTIPGRPIAHSRIPTQPDDRTPEAGDLDAEVGQDGEVGTGGGASEGSNDQEGGSGGGGGGVDAGSAGLGRGAPGGRNARPTIPVRGRVFAKSLVQGRYRIVATPSVPVSGKVLLALKAIGDDASGIPVRVAQAIGADGAPLEVREANLIGPLSAGKGEAIQIDVELVEPRKLAMEVEAHEA